MAKAAAVAVALTGVVAAPLVVAGAAPTEAVAAAASTVAASTEAVVAAIRFDPVRSGPDQSSPVQSGVWSGALRDWEASTDLVAAVASRDREQLAAIVVTVATAVAKFLFIDVVE